MASTAARGGLIPDLEHLDGVVDSDEGGEALARLSIDLEEAPCPMGCVRDDEAVAVGRERRHNLPGEFSVVRCRGCGLMRTNPRPVPAAIGRYYPSDYAPHQTRVPPGPSATRWRRPLWKRILLRPFEFNTTRIPQMAPGRLLEVGCGSGTFIDEMASRGWYVEGIEPSEAAARTARSLGHRVHCATIDDAPDPAQRFDLIVGWMVLEHLHDPIAALRKLARWSRPGGRLAISVPNAGSLEFAVFKDDWFALDVPRHLFHFEARTLRQALARAGWRTERVLHQRVLSNVIASLGLALQARGRDGALARALIDYPLGSGVGNLALYPAAFVLGLLGQTGRMTVWASRIDAPA